MNFQIFIVVFFLLLNRLVFSITNIEKDWLNFKIKYNKNYNETEERLRYKIFISNAKLINEHNKRFEHGNSTFALSHNQFSDMLRIERLQKLECLRTPSNYSRSDNGITYIPAANVKIPNFIDWRQLGAVTEVKNQEFCGSCWAFSATGSLEGQHFRKKGKLVSLSEQNLIDCSHSEGNDGCGGGFMESAFDYVKTNHGIDTEESYPYAAVEGKCQYNPKNRGADDRGFVKVAPGDEAKLQIAVATVGPISVAIDASHYAFLFYSHGIYNDPMCYGNLLNHGVLVVGYGTEDNHDYWLVKNSWGKTWGDHGYIKMTRNAKNQCGIATEPTYPLV